MAKAVISLQKESGGIVKISPVDGIGITEVTVPESGNLVSVDTSVTDNAIVRFDGTTGAVQNSSVTITDNGNVGIGNTLDNNTRRIGFTTAGGSSAIESATLGATDQYLVFKTTYGIESEKMRITGQGNVLVTGGGALGYGTGSGGTVTQLTSKSTAVTLNKPTGQIITSNSSLAAGAGVYFQFNCNLATIYDALYVEIAYPGSSFGNYRVETIGTPSSGAFYIKVTNISDSSLSEAISITFILLKGANA